MKRVTLLCLTTIVLLVISYKITLAQTLPAYVPTNNLIGWWPLDGNVNDLSGNGLNGNFINAQYLPSPFNQSAYFNGVNKLISIPTNSSFNTDTFSISLRFKMYASSIHNPIQFGVINGSLRWAINFQNNNMYYYPLTCAGGYGASGNYVYTNINNYVWYHLVIVNIGTRTKFYLDGVLIGDVNNAVPTNCWNSNMLWYLGGDIGGGAIEYYYGEFDEIGYWNRPLTYCEIQNLYTGLVSPITPITIFPQDTISICSASTTISAPANYSYSWNTSDTTQSINVYQTGWYSCTISNAGCTQTDSVFVSIVNANIQQNDTTICSGATLTLSVAQPSLGQTPCNSSLLPTNLQNGLVGYWPFCGNANDESGNGNNGVVNGALLAVDRYGNSNNSYQFNGINSYINGYISNLNNTSITTLSAWVKYIGDAGGQPYDLYFQYGTYGSHTFAYAYNYNGSNLDLYSNCFNNPYTSINLNNIWHHLVVVDSFNHTKVYLDGNLLNDFLSGGNLNCFQGSNYFLIGGGADNQFTTGYLDDIGFWNRALSHNEIIQLFSNTSQNTYLWSTGATTPTINVNPTQTTSYWVQVSNGITTCTDTIHVTVNSFSNLIAQDTIVTNSNTCLITATPGLSSYLWSTNDNTNTTTVVTTGWYYVNASNGICTSNDSVYVLFQNVPANTSCNASLKLDGIDDYGLIQNPFFQNLYQRDFTIEFYLKASPSQTQYPGIWGKTGFWNEINVELYTPGKLQFFYATSVGGQQYFKSDTVTWTPNQWDHYAIVGDQNSNTISIYKNGVLDGTTTHGTPYWGLPNNDSRIGSVFQGWTAPNWQYLNGKVDDFRVSNIKRYSSNFTPPQFLSTDSNTRVLYDFNNVLNNVVSDLSGNNNNLVLFNGAQLDYTDVPYSGNNLISSILNSDTISVCGTSTTINALIGLTNYQWSNGDTTSSTTVNNTGWYTLTASNGNCTATDSVFVSIVNANIQQNDTSICSGATLTLSVAQPNLGQTPCNSSLLPANLQNGLVGYWPFCGNANDESGNGNNGFVYGPTGSFDRFGNPNKAFDFLSTAGNYVEVPNTQLLNPSTGITIAAWFNLHQYVDNQNFVSKSYPIQILPYISYSIKMGPQGLSNKAEFQLCINGSNAAIQTTASIPLNQWNFIVGTYQGSIMKLYMNGVLLDSLSIQGNISSYNTNLNFGRWSTGSPNNPQYLDGYLDDVGIWNHALSSQEINQIFYMGNQLPQTYLWSTGDTTAIININPSQSTTYWVQVSNGITTCTDTIHVTVSNPNILIAVLPNDTLCAGQSLSLTANGASSYSWSGGVSNGQSFIPANSGVYTVTATNALGCTATSSVDIIVNALPTVNANATPSAICFGSSAVLSAIGGTSYLWQPGNLIGSPSVSPSATTTYTVTATNANGCSNTATRTVTVNSLPNINTSATPATICQGASSVLGATGGTSYSWQPGNLIGTPSVSPTVTTIYTVTSTNASGCSNTATQTIVVINLLSANASASPAVVCQGANSVLSAIGGTSYVWQPGNLTGSPTISPTATTTYTVTATNANGCTNSSTVTVSVNSLPSIVPSASPSAICIGNSSTLSAIGGISYVWQPGNLTGSPSVSPTATTTYTVTATNANGCSNTNTVTVLVNNVPTVAGSATPSSICLSGPSVLSATGGTSYMWIPGNLSGSPTVSPLVNTTYTVTALNANGCSNTTTVAVTVNNLPTVASSATPTSICLGGSTILSSTGGTSYIWQPGNLTGSPSVSPSVTTTYTVTATNANGCTNTATITVSVNNLPVIVPSASPSAICIGNSSTLSAIGGTSYVWQPGNLTGSPSVSPTATTTYTVTATNANGCTNSSTVTVSVNSLPTIGASALPSAICIGNSTTLSAIGGTNYVWQPGNLTASPSVSPTATTTYTVTGTNVNGCSNTATVDVIVNNLPTPSAAANPNSFCVGGSSVLSATGGTNYLWQPGNLNGTPTVSPTANTVYTVTVSDANGCSATTTVSIAVNATPNVVIAGNPPSICIGTSYLLNATGASTYVWMPGNLGGTPTVTPLSTTTYTVTGTNANGCSNTTSITLTVNALPLVSANANPSAVCAGSSTSLSGNGGVAYVWMPGNLSGSPLVAPNTPTTYTVTATDNNGCSNTATVLVGVNALPNVTALAIPNEICNGGSANLQGNGASSYFWMPGNIFGAPMVFPNATTTYTVTGTAANGCSATATALLNVVAPPIITQQPSNQVSTNGSSAQFTIQSNNPNASYQWQVDNGFGFQNLTNGGQYSGVNTTTLNIANLTQANNGNLFRCQVSLPGCVVTSIQVILKVEFALGINTTSTQGIFGIYPNPATSTLHISTPAPYLGSTLELRDMSGRICYSTTLKQEEVSIPVASWARGVYMLHVQNEQGHWVYRVLLRD